MRGVSLYIARYYYTSRLGARGFKQTKRTTPGSTCQWDTRLFYLFSSFPPPQYIADVKYNEKMVSVYMSNFTEGSKVNNYTLMVNKDTDVSSLYSL